MVPVHPLSRWHRGARTAPPPPIALRRLFARCRWPRGWWPGRLTPAAWQASAVIREASGGKYDVRARLGGRQGGLTAYSLELDKQALFQVVDKHLVTESLDCLVDDIVVELSNASHARKRRLRILVAAGHPCRAPRLVYLLPRLVWARRGRSDRDGVWGDHCYFPHSSFMAVDPPPSVA